MLAAGCGKPAAKFPVALWEGKVTLAGQPIPADAQAYVQFLPAGGGGQASTAQVTIVDGRYRAEQVPLGKVLVLFNISRLTGRMVHDPNAPDGPAYPDRENLVPAALQQGVALEVTGNQTKDFDLK